MGYRIRAMAYRRKGERNMTLEQHAFMKRLIDEKEYRISSYVITPDKIILFVTDIVPEQDKIPTVLFSKRVVIAKSL